MATNLVGNSLKYTDRGGSVTVSAEAQGEEVLLTVRDTGSGIPADQLPRIFERYYTRKRGANNPCFTVRKISYGVGVERVFPVHAPSVEKVELVTRGRVRRNRLYYLRQSAGKAARIEEGTAERAEAQAK